MTPIDVTVVIVSYKCAELTVDCLRSIEAERSTPGLRIEAIVVDNASGDAPFIAEAISTSSWSSWTTLIEAPKNGGFAYGNNLAFQRAYSDGPPHYFHLLNPDAHALKGAIFEMAHFLETHTDVGIAGGHLVDADGRDLSYAFKFPSILSEFESGLAFGLATRTLRPWVGTEPPAEPRMVDWVSGTSMMIRRELVDLIGGMDENYFLYFEDPDLCFRARKAGYSTWSVPDSRVRHISGQSTQVTGRHTGLKRMPTYWFESRRRYFGVNYGLGYAIATDVIAIGAHALGFLKRVAQRRQGVPHFIRDLIRNSLIWPRNRNLPPAKNFKVPANGLGADGLNRKNRL